MVFGLWCKLTILIRLSFCYMLIGGDRRKVHFFWVGEMNITLWHSFLIRLTHIHGFNHLYLARDFLFTLKTKLRWNNTSNLLHILSDAYLIWNIQSSSEIWIKISIWDLIPKSSFIYIIFFISYRFKGNYSIEWLIYQLVKHVFYLIL